MEYTYDQQAWYCVFNGQGINVDRKSPFLFQKALSPEFRNIQAVEARKELLPAYNIDRFADRIIRLFDLFEPHDLLSSIESDLC